MPDVTVFDIYRIRQALAAELAAGDRLAATACDDANGSYWVVTTSELIVLTGDTVTARTALETLQGDLTEDAAGTTLRVRMPPDDAVLIGTFRKPNKVTRFVADALG